MKLSYLLLTICYSLLHTACFKPNDYEKIDADKTLTADNNKQTVEADGVSTAQIKAQLSKETSPGKYIILFKSSLGFFKSSARDTSTAEADQNLIATVELASLTTGTAIITASIQNITATAKPEVEFTQAYPDNIRVTVDSFSIHAGYEYETMITALLSKSNGGKPSEGYRVDFTVEDDNGDSVGVFLNGRSFSATNNEGKASIRYSAGQTVKRGRLTVRASALKKDNTIGTATTQIFLTD